jgi:3-deoxy-D-manno-octulosonic-acid transferase
VVGWLLNTLYLTAAVALVPWAVWRAVRRGKRFAGFWKKLTGALTESSTSERVIWFHAVSVGEVLQLRALIPRLMQLRPGRTILITTSTSAGHAVARQTFPDCRIDWFPFDLTFAVRRALGRVRPELVVLVELELWPNFIREASSAGVPLMMINGRMSERSYRGYRKLRPMIGPLLRRFSLLAMQTDLYAVRLLHLGADPERVQITGSIKFDGVMTDRQTPQLASLRESFQLNRPGRVFMAGSTHEPEERIVLDAFAVLQEEFPDLRLVIVPRHPERFDDVARLIASRGFTLLRRSAPQSSGSDDASGSRRGHRPPLSADEQGSTGRAVSGRGELRTYRGSRLAPATDAARAEASEAAGRPVCLLDTLGELTACWGLADVAFVGGSLTERGGQNMIEPAACGAAVIVGPNTHNFRDVVEGLSSQRAIRIIGDAGELVDAVRTLLRAPAEAAAQGAAAREFVLAQQGATERTVSLLMDLLPADGSARPAQAA